MRALFIGRFQPFHYGHLHAVEMILEEADDLIIAVGSAQMSHDPDNPFTAGERIEMIKAALCEVKISREKFMIIPVADAPSHRTWVSYIESQLPKFDIVYSNQPLTRRLLIEAGYEVRIVKMFKRSIFEATEIRRRILKGEDWKDLVPEAVYKSIFKIDGESRIRDLGNTDRAPTTA